MEIILALALQILEHACHLLLDLLIFLLDFVVIVAMNPEEEFIFDMLVEELYPDLVLAGQSQHHDNFFLGELVLVVDEMVAAPLVEVIVEGSDLLLHQMDALQKSSQGLLGRQGLQLGHRHLVPVLRSERPLGQAVRLLAEQTAGPSEK